MIFKSVMTLNIIVITFGINIQGYMEAVMS